jgi:hypothetical protein
MVKIGTDQKNVPKSLFIRTVYHIFALILIITIV